MRLILAATTALIVASGGAMADQVAADERAAAESVRPAIIEAMKPFTQGPLATPEQTVCVGNKACQNLTTGKADTAVGACSGFSLLDGSDNVLVGAYTSTPTPHTSGFVNIANRLCFWRDTGERVACPAPEPECAK